MNRGWSLIAALGLLAGCSTIESINPFAAKPGPKIAELAPIVATVGVQSRWTSSIGKSDLYALQPAVVDQTVYAAAQDGSVARIEQGRTAWRVALNTKLSGGVGANETLVVVGSPEGEVIALAAGNGEVRWRARVSAEALGVPALGDGLVVVRSGDHRVFAFDAASGERRWVYQRATPALALRTVATPVISEHLVFAGFPGGKLVAVSTQNGAAVWEGTVALPKGTTELDRVADVVGAPAFTGREVCAVAFQGRVACFDLNNGGLLWARELSSAAGLTADQRAVYVTDDRGAVQAFDLANGSSLWKQDKLFLRQVTAPVVRRGLVAVGDLAGVVHLLNRDDGAFAGRINTDGSAILTQPQLLAGGVVVQTRNGGLFALDAQ